MAKKRDVLKTLVQEIDRLDPVERSELLERLFKDRKQGPWLKSMAVEHSGIVQTPGVCGGAARIIRTRIPVWTLERLRQLGLSESEILRSYPTLRAVDLVQAWSYAESHREEIENQIRENEEE